MSVPVMGGPKRDQVGFVDLHLVMGSIYSNIPSCIFKMLLDSPNKCSYTLQAEAEVSLRWYRGADYDLQAELNDMVKKKQESEAVSRKILRFTLYFQVS